MAEISALPVAMDDVSNPIDINAMQVTSIPAAPVIPAEPEPENASETLYIQNLNEKIKIDGH